MSLAELPDGLAPMLTGATGLPPQETGWGFEMKWDGQRALAYLSGGRVRLSSRTGHDITASYPELSGLGAALGARSALLDGKSWPSRVGGPASAPYSGG